MGLYDREYFRDEERRSGWSEWSMTTRLIVINVVVYIADMFFKNHALVEYGSLTTEFWKQPWGIITYGFLHSPDTITHVLFNMIGLWVFGREVEGVYGPKQFLRAYLTAIVVAGVVWLVFARAALPSQLVGASGAVMAMMMCFVCNFPKRIIMINLFIPVPAWLLGVLYVAVDFIGATNPNDHVAHVAHLGGVAYGYLFFRTGWTLFSLYPKNFRLGGPKLRVHRPSDPEAPVAARAKLSARVDDILDKITREGEASLTSAERRTLEEASRAFQKRRE